MRQTSASRRRHSLNFRKTLAATLLAGLSLSRLYAQDASLVTTGAIIAPSLSLSSGTVDGNNSTGYFVGTGGTLTATGVTFSTFSTTGGSGSGGGAGLGGAIFVAKGGTVTLTNVNFFANTATGGTAGVGAAGGSLNGLFQSTPGNAGNSLNGAGGADANSGAAYVNGGNGGAGYNGALGKASLTTLGTTGGNGGGGGRGSKGTLITSDTIYTAASIAFDSVLAAADAAKAAADSAEAAARTAEGAGNTAEAATLAALGAEEEAIAITDIAEGVAEDAAAADPFEAPAAIAASVGEYANAAEEETKVATEEAAAAEEAVKAASNDVEATQSGLQAITDAQKAAAAGVKAAADAAYLIALTVTSVELGTTGIGGNGGFGATGGKGGIAAGGGAGGNGGAGGDADSLANSLGGTGGNGGNGGIGGFGAGGGNGGNAGLGGASGQSNVQGAAGGAGSGGLAGFGGGNGTGGLDADGNIAGGQGGSGYGGAIFVQSGGSLTIQGSAVFAGNNSVAGDNPNNDSGTVGSSAGTDIFMMAGSHVTLDPGAGGLQIFNGTIADDSSTSIGTTGIKPGNGASITIKSGEVDFNGANTYSGQTLLVGGVLQAQDGTGLPTASNLNFAGGVLQGNGSFTRFLGTQTGRVQWTGDGGFAANGGALTVTLNSGQKLTWGSGNFVGVGNSLLFGSATATDNVTFTNDLNLNGHNGNVLVTANSDNSDTVTFSGVLSNGSMSFGDASHTGIVYLTGANTYANGTTVNGGTLALSAGGSLNAAAAVAVASVATFDISRSTGSQTIGDLSGAGTVALGANQLTLGTGTASVAFSGSLQDGGLGKGTGGSVIKQGSGTWTLTGANTYTGGTTISAGKLVLGLGGSLAATGDVTVAAGAGFDISPGTDQTVGNLLGAGTVSLGAHTLTLGTAADATFAGSIGGTGGVVKQGAGIWTLTNANSYTGSTTILAGTLALSGIGTAGLNSNIINHGVFDISASNFANIGSVSGDGIVRIGGRTLTVAQDTDTTFDGQIQDGGIAGGTKGSLIKQGAGTLTLTGVNSYSGLTDIQGGTLALSGAGTIVSNLHVSGTFDISQTGNQAVGVLSGAGSIYLGGDQLTLNQAQASTFGGTIADGGLGGGTGGSLEVSGSGPLTLTAHQTYSGGTTLDAGSTLLLAQSGSLLSTGSLAVAKGALFDISQATSDQTIGDLSGAGTLRLGSHQFNLGTANSTTFSGSIHDGGLSPSLPGQGATLVKQGAGTLTLTGANDYSQGTAIIGGTLALAGLGSLNATGTVMLAANTTLDLTGSTIAQTIGDLQSFGLIELGATQLTLGTARSSFISGNVTGAGSLVKQGAGDLVIMNSANTYSGGTFINQGGISLAQSSSLNAAGSVAVAGGAFLDLSSGSDQTIGSLSGAGMVILGHNRLTTGTAADSTFTGTLLDGFTPSLSVSLAAPASTGGSLTKQGTGTLTLDGQNFYTGGTIIAAGTLVIGPHGSLPTTGTVENDGILDLTQAAFQIIGDLTGTGTVRTGPDTLALGTTHDSTYSGTLEGAGSLDKIGSGTLTLTGYNTNTGPTTIMGGTLQVGNGGTRGVLGSGPIVNNGALVFDRSDTLTDASAISGTGSLTQLGTGTLILTGVNTSTGPITIANGTLQIGQGGTAGTLGSGPVIDNSHLVLDLSGNRVVTAALSGTGSLALTGPGTITLTAPDTRTGNTLIAQGTLIVGNGGSLASGPVTDNGNITFASPFTLANNGKIGGTGTVSINGPGLVALANESYTGSTYVSGGTLLAHGNFASSQLIIGTQGSVIGAFTLPGAVTNSGHLYGNPGGGSIIVGGSFNQSTSGTYIQELDGHFQYDLLSIQGNAKLGGTLKITLGKSFVPLLGQTFVVLNAGGTVFGAFQNLTSPRSLGLDTRYTRHSVYVVERRNLFESAATLASVRAAQVQSVAASPQPMVAKAALTPSRFTSSARILMPTSRTAASAPEVPAGEPTTKSAPLTANQLSVARALDAFVLQDGHTDRDSVILDWLERDLRSNLRHDFDLLSPEALSAIYQAGFASSIALGGNLDAQMDNLHAGAGQFGSITPTADGRSLLTSSDSSGDHLGLWVTGNAQFTSICSDAKAQGYDILSDGVTAGVDYRLTPWFALGGYFDYVNTDGDLPNGGHLGAHGGKGGGYASVFGHGFYLNVMGGAGSSDLHSSRGAFGGKASGNSSTTDREFRLTTGYDAHVGGFTLSPYASFQADTVDLHGYTEHGSLAPLKIQSHDESDLRSDLGVRVSYAARLGSAILRPSLHAAWEHDFSNSHDTIYSQLVGGSRTIATDSPSLGSNGAILGAGLSVEFHRASLFVSDEYHVGRSGYTSNDLTGGVRVSF